jgi:RNA polymerase sigma-70 factor (ECF subfamily)
LSGGTGAGKLTEPDVEIIAQARRGDPLAWEKLVSRHSRRIYNLCYRFVGKLDQAEDLTQEAFIKIFRNLGNYSPESGNFVTWIVSVTRNLLIDHYRQSKSERLTVSIDQPLEADADFTLLDTLPAERPSPQVEVERKEQAAFLHRALKQLSPDLREAVILRDLEELSYDEIAAILKIPDGTVKSRINRGRVELAKCIQRMKLQWGGSMA